MNSTELSTSDEGNCSNWNSFFANQHQWKRGLALAIRILKDPVEAEDVLQDASLRVIKHPDKKNKPSYFLKTVQNLCFSRLRRRSYVMLAHATPLDELSREESKEANMQIEEDCGFSSGMDDEREKKTERFRRIVSDCSQKLTNREKELLGLKMKGCDSLEIARRCQEDVTVIRVALNRLMNKMRYRCRRQNEKESGQ